MCEILGLTPSIKKGRERGKGEGQTSELPLKGNACRGTGGTDNIGKWSMDIMLADHTYMEKASEWQRKRQYMCSIVPGRQGKQFRLDLCIYFTLERKHKGAFSTSKGSTSSNYG